MSVLKVGPKKKIKSLAEGIYDAIMFIFGFNNIKTVTHVIFQHVPLAVILHIGKLHLHLGILALCCLHEG